MPGRCCGRPTPPGSAPSSSAVSRSTLQPQDGARLGRIALPRPLQRPGGPGRPGDLARRAGLSHPGHGGAGRHDYAALDWSVPTALFLGNEAAGLEPAVLEAIGGAVAIPMEGRAESLNVGVACAVLCFEALRQRRASGRGSAASTISVSD